MSKLRFYERATVWSYVAMNAFAFSLLLARWWKYPDPRPLPYPGALSIILALLIVVFVRLSWLRETHRWGR